MDEVYRQYAQTVYRYLLSLTRDADTAEELTQETFYQAIRSSEQFDESCALSTWLCAIAKRVLATYRRKHPPTEELEEQTLYSNDPDDDDGASRRRGDIYGGYGDRYGGRYGGGGGRYGGNGRYGRGGGTTYTTTWRR